jgi:hypothetical protein
MSHALPPQETIWRYMNFTKFVDLLSTQTLFFCRADRFDDPFEGSLSRLEQARQLSDLAQYDDSIKAREQADPYYKRVRRHTYINCWHLSEYESEALWSLYIRAGEGVAIKSSRQSVHAALEKQTEVEGIWSWPIEYIDFANDSSPMWGGHRAFRFKRRSFEHEKELRFLHQADEDKPPPHDYGLRIRIDLAELVQAVYVAPTSPQWFHDLTLNICTRLGLEVPVHKSELASAAPLFGA